MKYYKDTNNQIFAYEADGSQDAFIKGGLTQITDEEYAEMTAPPPETPEQIQVRINEEAIAYLSSTDWYVVRFVETGVAIPEEILAERQAARERVV
jgi:hypothetical protein